MTHGKFAITCPESLLFMNEENISLPSHENENLPNYKRSTDKNLYAIMKVYDILQTCHHTKKTSHKSLAIENKSAKVIKSVIT